MNIEQLRINLNTIRDALKETFTPEDIVGLIDHNYRLINLMALAAECEARTERFMKKSIAYHTELLIVQEKYKKTSVMLLKEIAQGHAADFIELHTESVRLGRAISHAVDFNRSVISFQKDELNRQSYQS